MSEEDELYKKAVVYEMHMILLEMMQQNRVPPLKQLNVLEPLEACARHDALPKYTIFNRTTGMYEPSQDPAYRAGLVEETKACLALIEEHREAGDDEFKARVDRMLRLIHLSAEHTRVRLPNFEPDNTPERPDALYLASHELMPTIWYLWARLRALVFGTPTEVKSKTE